MKHTCYFPYQVNSKKYFVHAAWLVIKLYESSGHLFPLNDSHAIRYCILVALRAASYPPCRLVIGEYLLSGRSVGTHLELTYGEYFARHGEYGP